MKRMLKWDIPLDDEWHEIPKLTAGWHVAHQTEGFVTLWTETDLGTADDTSRARVFGTGQPFANTCTYLGSAMDPRGFVWHLIEAERSP